MYRQLYRPNHPRADVTGLVAEHILVAETCLGRRLKKGEIVHHKDFDKSNNDYSNLFIGITRKQHQQLPEYQARFIIAKGLYKEFLSFWKVEQIRDIENREIKEVQQKLIKTENARERMKRKEAQNENM